MAGQTATDGQFNPYLSSTQQDLLLAALASNNYNASNALPLGNAIKRSDSDPSRDREFVPPSYVDGALVSAAQKPIQGPAEIGSFDFDDTSPYIDYIDGDTTLNFDSNDLGGEDMFGNVPGPMTESSESDKGDRADKRKSPDDADLDEDDDPKRREGDDKTAKKPGRKPLTSEPTTVGLSPLLSCLLFNRAQPLIESTETQGPKPRCSTRLQRAQGEAPQGSRDKGRQPDQGPRGRQA